MSKYPRLDYARYTETTLKVQETLAADSLKNSYGSPTMSEEDVKTAIVSLLMINERQQVIIDELVRCVNELRDTAKTRRTKKH